MLPAGALETSRDIQTPVPYYPLSISFPKIYKIAARIEFKKAITARNKPIKEEARGVSSIIKFVQSKINDDRFQSKRK